MSGRKIASVVWREEDIVHRVDTRPIAHLRDPWVGRPRLGATPDGADAGRGGAQLTRTHKDERSQLKGRLDYRVTAAPVYGPQELRDLARLGNRRPILHVNGRQGTSQVCGS